MICPICQSIMLFKKDMCEDPTMDKWVCDMNEHYCIYYSDSVWWITDHSNDMEIGCNLTKNNYETYVRIKNEYILVSSAWFNKSKSILNKYKNLKIFL